MLHPLLTATFRKAIMSTFPFLIKAIGIGGEWGDSVLLAGRGAHRSKIIP
jgi:hypothetical protein